MKKLLIFLLLAMSICCVLAFTVSAEEGALPETCPYCNKKVTWSPLTEANASDDAVSNGHRYLAFEGDSAQWKTKSVPKTVCLYMNGKTITGTDGRVFSVGGTLNLIGEGTVSGRAVLPSVTSYGGTINVSGTLNVYGTTINTTMEEGRTTGRGGAVYLGYADSVMNLYSGKIVGGTAKNGGAVYTSGTVNVYDGEIVGGTATGDSSSNGGAFYISGTGVLNVYGGTISGGTATKFGGCLYAHNNAGLNIYGGTVSGGTAGTSGGTIYARGDVFTMSGGTVAGGTATKEHGGAIYVYDGTTFQMSGGTVKSGKAGSLGPCVMIPAGGKIILSGGASIAELKFTSYTPEQLTLTGNCTGTVMFRGSTGQAVDGAYIGIADNADTSRAKYTVYNTDLYVVAKGEKVLISGVGTVNPVQTEVRFCPMCGRDATWMTYGPEDYEVESSMPSGHYVVTSEDTECYWQQKTVAGDDRICLDLNGKTLKGNSRAFHISTGTLNIMDSVGGGVVTASGPYDVSSVYGGTFIIRATGRLNLYSGKLTYELPTDGRSYVARGGVVYNLGVVNVFGGEISGGAAKAGGNIYNDADSTGVGHLGLYGGVVGGNVKVPGASTSGPCIISRGTVVLSGDADAVNITLTSSNYSPASGDRIVVSGKYTGTVTINNSSWSAASLDMGNSENGDISEANITFKTENSAAFYIIGTELLAYAGTPAALVKADGNYQSFETVQEAIASAGSTGLVILLADAENIAVNGMVHVDLNGYDITGAAGNGTLVCKDSRTDDFTVADGIYGKVTDASCQIAAMTNAFAEDHYLMAAENGYSFHRVQLQITNSVIRPSAAGIYYTCSFLGDEVAASMIETVGIVLNASELPSVINMETTSLYTAQGAEGFNTTGTSCLLSGILKTGNSDAENNANAETLVYAAAYVTAKDGTILFGTAVSTNFKDQVTAINSDWSRKTVQQKRAFMDMFYTYEELMQTEGWSVSNAVSIAARKEKFETTDYSAYLCPWNYDVVAQAKADGKIHYYFFAGEGLHISDTQTYKDKWGDSFLVVFPNGQTLLVDSGPLSYAPVVAENLRRMGITHLDAILVTHPHSDHHNGLFSDSAVLNIGFLTEITVDQVYYRGGTDPEKDVVDLVSRVCRDLNIPCDVMEKGDVLYFGDVKLECVWPLLGEGDSIVSGGEEINNMSIVVRIDYGEHSSLLTGDLYMKGEKWVLERVDNSLLDVDFLKVPHHGYNTSSSCDFIEAISPEVAMAIGRLPIPEKVRARYETLGVTFLDDRTNGYVEVTGSLDGTLEYTVSRTEAEEVPPSTGDEDVLPDADED